MRGVSIAVRGWSAGLSTWCCVALVAMAGSVPSGLSAQAATAERSSPNSLAENWVRLREVNNSIRTAAQLRDAADSWADEAKHNAESDEDTSADARTEKAVEANYRAVARAAREELGQLRPEAALLQALVSDNRPTEPLTPDLQARADRVGRDSISRSDLSGLWATPRGSLVRLLSADGKLRGEYVSRVNEDPKLAGDTVFDGQMSRGQVSGEYYATYPSKRADHLAKCGREHSDENSVRHFLAADVQLMVAPDGQSLTGLTRYQPGDFATGCDRGPTQIAYDVIKLRRVTDASSKIDAIALTGSQTDDAIPKSDGGGFWGKVRAGLIIAGAVTAAAKGDSVTANKLIGYLVDPTSANTSAATASTEPTESAATAGTGGTSGGPYTGPYSNEVSHLLSRVSGWKFSSCATCTDFVFPSVRMNQNSQRDAYVSAAVMQAFAAAAHAHVGKPNAAAENARSMHENLKQANALCSSGARSFSSPGSGPQTLGIWSCPPPM